MKMRQNSRLNLDFSFSDGLSSRKQRFDESFGLRVFKIGYEVYADGLTRVLRICEHADNPEIEKKFSANIKPTVQNFLCVYSSS